jgi:membrane associated rhomboid family serine protease
MSELQAGRRSGGTGILAASVAMALVVAALWMLEALDQASGNALDGYGIRPRTDEGLVSVFLAPWLHGSWAHLVSNTVPFFVLGVLVLLEGWRRWLQTTLVVVVASGAAVWLLAPAASITLGASGVVFGWLTYLIVRGFYTRHPGQIALGVVVFLLYGGALWGVLPSDVGVSWQAHLGGAVGGFIAARSRRTRGRPAPARLG